MGEREKLVRYVRENKTARHAEIYIERSKEKERGRGGGETKKSGRGGLGRRELATQAKCSEIERFLRDDVGCEVIYLHSNRKTTLWFFFQIFKSFSL